LGEHGRKGDLSDGAGEAENTRHGNSRVFSIQSEPAELSVSQHEAQSSALAAQPGKLLCDYIRVVLPDEPKVRAELEGWLGESKPRAGGWHGWYDRSASVLEGGLLAWCSNGERAKIEGLLCDLPGRACGALGARLLSFLRWAHKRGRLTRLDFAVDDMAGRLTRERVLAALDEGTLLMRWQDTGEVVKRRRGALTGWTLYLGKRTGQSQARIYDKGLEQGLAGVSWMRFELEAKGAFAHRLAAEYFTKGSDAVKAQIVKRVKFVEPVASDTNKARWPLAPWWASFIGDIEPGQSLAPGVKPACTVERLSRFVERCAGPSIATVVEALDGEVAWLDGVIERSGWRLNKSQEALIKREREKRAKGAPVRAVSAPGVWVDAITGEVMGATA